MVAKIIVFKLLLMVLGSITIGVKSITIYNPSSSASNLGMGPPDPESMVLQEVSMHYLEDEMSLPPTFNAEKGMLTGTILCLRRGVSPVRAKAAAPKSQQKNWHCPHERWMWPRRGRNKPPGNTQDIQERR